MVNFKNDMAENKYNELFKEGIREINIKSKPSGVEIEVGKITSVNSRLSVFKLCLLIVLQIYLDLDKKNTEEADRYMRWLLEYVTKE